MPRLADTVAAGQFTFPSYLRGPDSQELTTGIRRHLVTAIPNAPVIVADNVTATFVQDLEARGEDLNYAEDLPCLAAPFPQFWVEARAPAGAPMSGYRAWGALITAHDFEEYSPAERDELRQFLGNADARWMLLASMVYEHDQDGVLAGLADFSLLLDTSGRPAAPPKWLTFRAGGGAHLSEAGQEEVVNEATMLSWPLLQAVCFMHCTNVELVEHRPPTRPAVRRGGSTRSRKLLRYHTLTVTPATSTRFARALNENEISGGVALHLMRGHFKDYRTGGGLFGRHHGLYWWGPALRGTGLRGVVDKSYDVHRGDEDPMPAPRPTRPTAQ